MWIKNLVKCNACAVNQKIGTAWFSGNALISTKLFIGIFLLSLLIVVNEICIVYEIWVERLERFHGFHPLLLSDAKCCSKIFPRILKSLGDTELSCLESDKGHELRRALSREFLNKILLIVSYKMNCKACQHYLVHICCKLIDH